MLAAVFIFLLSACASAHSLEYYTDLYSLQTVHIHTTPATATNLTVAPVYDTPAQGLIESLFGISSQKKNPPLPFYELKTRTDEDGDVYLFLYPYTEYQFTFPDSNTTYYLYPVEYDYTLYVPN